MLLVRAALDELARSSPISFQILHLRMFEGRSVAEVAAELGLTPEQVYSRQHRAIGKLRSMLEWGSAQWPGDVSKAPALQPGAPPLND